jgi:hypothetical protein
VSGVSGVASTEEGEAVNRYERAVIDASLEVYEKTMAMDTHVDRSVAVLREAEAAWGVAVRALLEHRRVP